MITIERTEDNVIIDCGEGMLFSETFSLLMQALEAVSREVVKDITDTEDRETIFDAIDAAFGQFLRSVFPDIDPHEFDLTDAAIVKAQDEIINDAHKRGITFEQALKEYEDKAKEYIDARKMS